MLLLLCLYSRGEYPVGLEPWGMGGFGEWRDNRGKSTEALYGGYHPLQLQPQGALLRGDGNLVQYSTMAY